MRRFSVVAIGIAIAALVSACSSGGSKSAPPVSTATVVAVVARPTEPPPTPIPATPTPAPPTFEVKKIDTRPGVTMRFALSVPASPKATLIMFTGGDGTNAFTLPGGVVHLTGNFVVRTSPDFVKQGFAVAVLDVPSDQTAGMTPQFRTTMPTAQDIAKVIDYLDGQGIKSIYLVGTSNGTLSAAYVASVNSDPRIKGLVLTSTVNANPRFGAIAIDKISVPTLVVYHHDDGCESSPPSGVAPMVKKLTTKVNVIEVSGGSPPQSDACDAQSQHGYFGIEAPVVQAISDWISGKPVRATIGP